MTDREAVTAETTAADAAAAAAAAAAVDAAYLSTQLTSQWLTLRNYSTPFSDEGLNRAAISHRQFLESLCDLAASNSYRSGLDRTSEIHVSAASKTLIGGSRSEWLKWIGFFVLGVFATQGTGMLTAAGAPSTAAVWTLVMEGLIAGVALTWAAIIDRPWSAAARLLKKLRG